MLVELNIITPSEREEAAGGLEQYFGDFSDGRTNNLWVNLSVAQWISVKEERVTIVLNMATGSALVTRDPEDRAKILAFLNNQ